MNKHITVLQCYSITVLQYYSITVLQYYSITGYSITVLQCYSITVLQCYSITVLQVTVLQYYSVTVLQYYSITDNKMATTHPIHSGGIELSVGNTKALVSGDAVSNTMFSRDPIQVGGKFTIKVGNLGPQVDTFNSLCICSFTLVPIYIPISIDYLIQVYM